MNEDEDAAQIWGQKFEDPSSEWHNIILLTGKNQGVRPDLILPVQVWERRLMPHVKVVFVCPFSFALEDSRIIVLTNLLDLCIDSGI